MDLTNAIRNIREGKDELNLSVFPLVNSVLIKQLFEYFFIHNTV